MDPAFPSIADGVDHSLDPRYVPLQRLHAVFVCGVLGVASFAGMMALWIQSGRLLAGLGLVPLWLAGIGAVVWHLRRWPAIDYRHVFYRVDDLGIEIRRGVYFREVINVPRSRRRSSRSFACRRHRRRWAKSSNFKLNLRLPPRP